MVDICSDPGFSMLLASPLLWRHAAVGFLAVAYVLLLLTSQPAPRVTTDVGVPFFLILASLQ